MEGHDRIKFFRDGHEYETFRVEGDELKGEDLAFMFKGKIGRYGFI